MRIIVQRLDNNLVIDNLFTVESFSVHVGESLVLPAGAYHMPRYYTVKEVLYDFSAKPSVLRLFVAPMTGDDYMM